jgi:hypothetical protein
MLEASRASHIPGEILPTCHILIVFSNCVGGITVITCLANIIQDTVRKTTYCKYFTMLILTLLTHSYMCVYNDFVIQTIQLLYKTSAVKKMLAPQISAVCVRTSHVPPHFVLEVRTQSAEMCGAKKMFAQVITRSYMRNTAK